MAGVLGSVHRTQGQPFHLQTSEWLHYPLQPQEGEISEGWLPLEEAEGREDHPRGPHEAEGPRHGGKQGIQLIFLALPFSTLSWVPALPWRGNIIHLTTLPVTLPFLFTLHWLAVGLARSLLPISLHDPIL